MERLRAEDPVAIGRFELRARLGAGGMGQVYLGQAAGGELVAVKVVHAGYAADAQFRARFGREVRIARQVRASWAVTVRDADPDASQPWLATEFVSGPALDRLVANDGPLAASALLVLAVRLAGALAELHAMGLVHRDLKPSNVLVAADGPRLIDFGIARAVDSTKITHTGMAVGTPAFMSPEQATGEPEGTASDVFSLASVLVFAASGQGPFGQTATPVAMLKRVVGDVPDLSGLPDELRPELGRCLAKDPIARPVAAELAARLGTIAQRAPADAWPPAAVVALTRQAERAVDELTGPGGAPTRPPAPRRPAPHPAAAHPPAAHPPAAHPPAGHRPVLGPPGLPPRRPAPGPPRRTWRAPLVIGLALLLVLAAVGTVLGVRYLGGAGGAVPVAAPAPSTPLTPMPTALPTAPSTGLSSSAPPAAEPPRVLSAPLIPSQVPGWSAAVSTTRNAAYDVPPDWRPQAPGLVKGYQDAQRGLQMVMSGVAEHGSLRCPGEDRPQPDSWSGVTGQPTGDTAAAARALADLWAGGAYQENGRRPVVRLSGPVSVTAGGRTGSHVTATVTKPAGSCGSPEATVHAVALPGNGGQSVVWVLMADSGTLADADLARVISSLRPAGLTAKCDKAGTVVGSWC